MFNSTSQSLNMTLPPLIAAVRDFAQLHNLGGLNDPKLDLALAKVAPADHLGMYAVISEVLPKVPIYLHSNVFDAFSDALITPHTAVSYFDANTPEASQAAGDRLNHVLSLMEQAIREDSSAIFSESDHQQSSSPTVKDQVPVESKPVPSQTPNPQTDATRRKGVTKNLPVVTAAMNHTLKSSSVNSSTGVNTSASVTNMRLGFDECFQWPVAPESGFVSSSKLVDASYLDIAGVFPASIPVGVFPRRFGTSFFATQIDPTSKNVPNSTHEPRPNAHALALYSAGHIPRHDLPHVYVPSCHLWGPAERAALRHAVVKLANTHTPDDLREPSVLQNTTSNWSLAVWENIAQTYSWQLGYRTGNQVRVQYLKKEAPWISTHEWTTDEDNFLQNKKQLDKLLKERNGGWDTVSNACKNTHSSVDCLRRWRYLQDESIRKVSRRRWKDSEDRKLFQVKLALRNKPWEEVALALGTLRSPQQCRHRHEKRLSCRGKPLSSDNKQN